jgi:hypothetical protein
MTHDTYSFRYVMYSRNTVLGIAPNMPSNTTAYRLANPNTLVTMAANTNEKRAACLERSPTNADTPAPMNMQGHSQYGIYLLSTFSALRLAHSSRDTPIVVLATPCITTNHLVGVSMLFLVMLAI